MFWNLNIDFFDSFKKFIGSEKLLLNFIFNLFAFFVNYLLLFIY